MAIQFGQLNICLKTLPVQGSGIRFGKTNAAPPELDHDEFRRRFADAIREHSVRVNPKDVMPRGPQYHMWLLPNGELRQIPDMEHEQMAKKLFASMRLRGSTFFDDDGTRFRERAIADGGLVKVCSHHRQLQIAIPVDITDAQMRVIYSLSRSHASENLAWEIRSPSGENLGGGEKPMELGWRFFRNDFQRARYGE